jgi:glycosyltransferase involved in cell wall biosynthesis
MISVVIPSYNEERLLPDCLESLRNQDYKGEFEIIVADNASTDNTASIARNFGARVIDCAEEKGVAYARQAGADAARGDIIAQADADTIYPADWLTRIATQLASHPEAVAIAGRFIYRDPPSWARIEYFFRHGMYRVTAALFGRPLLPSGATLAFQRTAFLAVNGYKNSLYSPDQWGLSARLGKMGKILYDHNLCVLTSSRAVRKPFVNVLADFFVDHLIGGLGVYLVRYSIYLLSGRNGKTKPTYAESRNNSESADL